MTTLIGLQQLIPRTKKGAIMGWAAGFQLGFLDFAAVMLRDAERRLKNAKCKIQIAKGCAVRIASGGVG
jgi:hypothetical protein